VISELPNENQRLRCGRCGNLTRFDVVRSATTKEFWHLEIAGNPQVEEVEIQASALLSVTCRWCGAVDEVELVDRLELE
jgi:hypothetical protein